MRNLEKWIWLDSEKYPDAQTTVFHPRGFSPGETVPDGNYTVAEFTKTYRFQKRVKSAKLRFAGDTEFDLWLNGSLLATGPVCVGGDFLFNDTPRDPVYATEMIVNPGGSTLWFYARVKMMPVLLNEYSKGHGGFMLTAHITFADETMEVVTTDNTWMVRRNGQYTEPFRFDGSMKPDGYAPAQEVPNVWHTETAPIPVRSEETLYPQGGGEIRVAARSKKVVRLEFDKVYGAFLKVFAKTSGLLLMTVECFELEKINSREELIFDGDTEYRGLQMHSVGGYIISAENCSNEEAVLHIGCIATCYPVTECAAIETGDTALNHVLGLCTQALKYCRQTIHLDSPKHCEPLACTGDYYIESLMTAFSFGDMRLAAFDVRRTAEMLCRNDGRLFHTSYSLIWVMMLYDVYMFTGDRTLLTDCVDGLWFLLHRFEGYMGNTGLVENPPDYMFVDWLMVDGYTLHHPPKNLGQGCLNMFYYGALMTAEKVYRALSMDAMAAQCQRKAMQLKNAINLLLYSAEKGLYCEGLATPTPQTELNCFLPQSNGKLYYRKHANILAACFGVCDTVRARTILHRVMTDETLGDCQPYFMHFLLEAIYRSGLRDTYTLPLMECWKQAAAICPKGLEEGFVCPENYSFDLSHAWGGTPLYAIPRALLGFEMIEPGFKKIRLTPSLLGLPSAMVEMLTPYGKIVCWQEVGKAPKMDVPDRIVMDNR